MYNIAALDSVYLVVIFALLLSLAYVIVMDENMTLVEDPTMEASDLDGRLDLYRVRRAVDYHLNSQEDQQDDFELDLAEYRESEEKDRSSSVRLAASDGESKTNEQDLDRDFRIFESGGSWEDTPKAEHVAEITPLSEDVSDKLISQAEELELELSLLLGLIQVESRFDDQNVSHAGAIGLMQLMPNTARPVTERHNLEYDFDKLFDPFYNIKLGTKQLRFLLEEYDGDIYKALTAYNRGQGGLQSYMNREGTAESTFARVVLEHSARFEQELEEQLEQAN